MMPASTCRVDAQRRTQVHRLGDARSWKCRAACCCRSWRPGRCRRRRSARCSCPCVASTGLMASNSSCSAPTMKVRVPASAPARAAGDRRVGHGIAARLSAACGHVARGVRIDGARVDQRDCRGRAPPARPRRPRYTLFTCGEEGSMVITSSRVGRGACRPPRPPRPRRPATTSASTFAGMTTSNTVECVAGLEQVARHGTAHVAQDR